MLNILHNSLYRETYSWSRGHAVDTIGERGRSQGEGIYTNKKRDWYFMFENEDEIFSAFRLTGYSMSRKYTTKDLGGVFTSERIYRYNLRDYRYYIGAFTVQRIVKFGNKTDIICTLLKNMEKTKFTFYVIYDLENVDKTLMNYIHKEIVPGMLETGRIEVTFLTQAQFNLILYPEKPSVYSYPKSVQVFLNSYYKQRLCKRFDITTDFGAIPSERVGNLTRLREIIRDNPLTPVIIDSKLNREIEHLGGLEKVVNKLWTPIDEKAFPYVETEPEQTPIEDLEPAISYSNYVSPLADEVSEYLNIPSGEFGYIRPDTTGSLPYSGEIYADSNSQVELPQRYNLITNQTLEELLQEVDELVPTDATIPQPVPQELLEDTNTQEQNLAERDSEERDLF